MCSAIPLRIAVMGSTVSPGPGARPFRPEPEPRRPPARAEAARRLVEAAGAAGAAGASGAAVFAPPCSTKARMSFFVTRPPRPVPAIWRRRRRARRRCGRRPARRRRAPAAPVAVGLAVGRRGAGVSAAGSGSVAARRLFDLGRRGRLALGAACVRGLLGGLLRRRLRRLVAPARRRLRARSTASFVPTSTVSPSGTRICVRTPLAGLGTSVSTLSVEISSSASSAAIASPSAFSHFVIVPSETETPIWGMTTSTAVSVAMVLLSTSARSSRPATTSSTCGMNHFSSGGENGTGVSGAAIRFTGASRCSKASSTIVATISAPKPAVCVSSWRTSAFDVFATDSSTASRSHGMIVRRSMISTESSPSSCLAASSAV